MYNIYLLFNHDHRSYKSVASARKQARLDSSNNRMELDEPEFNILKGNTILFLNKRSHHV